MRKLASVLVVLGVIAGFQTVAQKRAGTAAALREHVKYLASEELQGRHTTSPGATKAGEYIARKFREAGLKPAGANNTYFHEFQVMGGIKPGPNATLSVTAKATPSIKLNAGVHFVPLAFSRHGHKVDAEVVFVGYGISAPDLGWDDYAGQNVTGKVVLALRGTPKGQEAKLEEHTAVSDKEAAARAKGAVGILLVGEARPGMGELVALQGGVRENKDRLVAISATVEAANLILRAQGKTLAALRRELDQNQSPRSFVTGATVSMQTEVVREAGTGKNVLGLLPGTDPALKSQIIVIGGHYDHLGRGQIGSLSGSSQIHYGADDNASGTAAVIEVARQFAAAKKNKRTLLFVGFSGEEEGLLGSRAFADAPTVDAKSIVAMLNADMVGRMKEKKLQIGGVGTSPGLERLVESLNTDKFDLSIEQSGIGPSDHTSFYRKNIPVLFFFTGIHADYHRHTDTWDKINYDDAALITGYIYRIARAMDDRRERLAFSPTPGGMSALLTQRSSEERPDSGSDEPTGPRRSSLRVSLGLMPTYGGDDNGLLLDGVREGSAAEKAGLKGGDRIVKWGGEPIKNIQDLMANMAKAKPGDKVALTVVRNGETKELVAVLEAAGK